MDRSYQVSFYGYFVFLSMVVFSNKLVRVKYIN